MKINKTKKIERNIEHGLNNKHSAPKPTKQPTPPPSRTPKHTFEKMSD